MNEGMNELMNEGIDDSCTLGMSSLTEGETNGGMSDGRWFSRSSGLLNE